MPHPPPAELLAKKPVRLTKVIDHLAVGVGSSTWRRRSARTGTDPELSASRQLILASLKACGDKPARIQADPVSGPYGIGQTERALSRALQRDPLLAARVERLMTIPAVGPLTALSWVLEIGDVSRFASLKQAVSYCGLCSAEISSAGIQKRSPLSKQRNKHLQTVLIEAAKIAPLWNPDLALLYDKEKRQGNRNRATLAVARKLVAYLLAVDRRETPFEKGKQPLAAAAA